MNIITHAPQILEAMSRGESFWTIHLDELDDWLQVDQTAEAWIAASIAVFRNARRSFPQTKRVVIAISLLPSNSLMTNFEATSLDFFTPPALYLMNEKFEYPASAERYQLRIQNLGDFSGHCYFTSTQSIEAKTNGWEYDNTLYLLDIDC
jgi:hypothetical protein